jgi:hypothetical protein
VTAYEHLLRNRIVMSPMETMYGTPDGVHAPGRTDPRAARRHRRGHRWFEPNLRLHDAIAARLPGVEVYAVGDCRGYGLVRQATEDAARAAYEWGQTSDRSRA